MKTLRQHHTKPTGLVDLYLHSLLTARTLADTEQHHQQSHHLVIRLAPGIRKWKETRDREYFDLPRRIDPYVHAHGLLRVIRRASARVMLPFQAKLPGRYRDAGKIA